MKMQNYQGQQRNERMNINNRNEYIDNNKEESEINLDDQKNKNIMKKKINNQKTIILSERDFYPPPDHRYLKSNVSDIWEGNSYQEWCRMYNQYTNENYD